MKAHVNKPFHPLLRIPFPVHRKKEGPEASVVQYREMGLGHLTTPVPNGFTLTISRQNRLKNQYHYPYLHEVNKNYRDCANSTIIPHDTDSRIPDLSVFKSEIWHRGVQQAKKFSS
ncbi:unnamed protein product [Rangifer tarandus platyrhynchus]|uniref:Uncharacterized protein n=2 Tax=Rangifer tarandus platyrhynchus TaxID=3082113 RepID=A0AC59ZKJ7_RANTA|nr:unnamed protein product [Rangifer tarandus platyrhynchus]